jgi:hypothetical protein
MKMSATPLLGLAALAVSGCEVSLASVPIDRSCYLSDLVFEGREGNLYGTQDTWCNDDAHLCGTSGCVENRNCTAQPMKEPCFLEAKHARAATPEHLYWDGEAHIYRHDASTGSVTALVDKEPGRWFSRLLVDERQDTLVVVDEGNLLATTLVNRAPLRSFGKLPVDHRQISLRNGLLWLHLASGEIATLDPRSTDAPLVPVAVPAGAEFVVSEVKLFRASADHAELLHLDLYSGETGSVALPFRIEALLHHVYLKPGAEFLIVSSRVDDKRMLWSIAPDGTAPILLTGKESASTEEFLGDGVFWTTELRDTSLLFRTGLSGDNPTMALLSVGPHQGFVPSRRGVLLEQEPGLQFVPLRFE